MPIAAALAWAVSALPAACAPAACAEALDEVCGELDSHLGRSLKELMFADVGSSEAALLDRTEFMPFAPVTLDEEADRCYSNLGCCRHAAEFMTITRECSAEMRRTSPAVVHLDDQAQGIGAPPGLAPGRRQLDDVLETHDRLEIDFHLVAVERL